VSRYFLNSFNNSPERAATNRLDVSCVIGPSGEVAENVTFQELRILAGSGSIRSIGGTLLLRHAEQLGVAIAFVPSLCLSEV
jgi:hypothetical protein